MEMYLTWSVQLSVELSRRPKFTIFDVNSRRVYLSLTLGSDWRKAVEVLTLLPITITFVFNSFPDYSRLLELAQVATASTTSLSKFIAFSTSSGSQCREI